MTEERVLVRERAAELIPPRFLPCPAQRGVLPSRVSG